MRFKAQFKMTNRANTILTLTTPTTRNHPSLCHRAPRKIEYLFLLFSNRKWFNSLWYKRALDNRQIIIRIRWVGMTWRWKAQLDSPWNRRIIMAMKVYKPLRMASSLEINKQIRVWTNCILLHMITRIIVRTKDKIP